MTPDFGDDPLARRLATELPRYTAPARLRVSIVEAMQPRVRRGFSWLSPLVASAATAMVLLLFGLTVLPRVVPADPVQRMVRAVVSEHSRALMWGARRPEIIPTALPWLTQESGIGLAGVFAGDDRLQFTGAEPVYLERERGIALHYRDVDGHLVSYVVLPAAGLQLPERERLKVDRYRPLLMRDSGFSSWVWKHGDLACFLVSDMVSSDDLERFKDYFVRVRSTTEPFQAY
jgi:hypothetical protein